MLSGLGINEPLVHGGVASSISHYKEVVMFHIFNFCIVSIVLDIVLLMPTMACNVARFATNEAHPWLILGVRGALFALS